MIKKLIVSSTFMALAACSSSSPEQDQDLMITQNAQDVVDCAILGVFNADNGDLNNQQYRQSLNDRVIAMHGNAVKLTQLTTAEPEMLSAHVYLCPQ